MVKQRIVFTVKERITGVTSVKLIRLLRQERKKKQRKLLYLYEAKSSIERLQSKQAMFSLLESCKSPQESVSEKIFFQCGK